MRRTTAVVRSFIWLGAVLLFGGSAEGQTWQTWANQPGNGEFHRPLYPIAFVAAEIRDNIDTDHHGTDVRTAGRPRNNNHLYLLNTDGSVVKLFPLDVHATPPTRIIDTPPGELWRGSVVEPNISESGRLLYFSYFHSACVNNGVNLCSSRPASIGADLYRIDLGPLLDGDTNDAARLPVERLTKSHATPMVLTPSDWADTAMNFVNTNTLSLNDWGTVYMHAVEMRKEGQLKLAYVSNERRLRNSNSSSFLGHNFNLHLAEVPPFVGGENLLQNRRQFQYYTTTSALSPAPVREGISFSYQASTEDLRLWQIQGLDSAGRWYPMMGYGRADFLFHLGTFCYDNVAGKDYFVGTLYYTGNNEGFGSLYRQDLSQAGLNLYPSVPGQGLEARQAGQIKLTPAIADEDIPSTSIGGGRFVGKITSPRCGKLSELYLSYTSTPANSHGAGNRIYDAMIAYRPNLQVFDPGLPYGDANGLKKVVVDGSGAFSLVWPTPVLSWYERTKDTRQRSSRAILAGDIGIPAGSPWAQVGTSALYNTDRRPYDCWLWTENATGTPNPFNPNRIEQQKNEATRGAADGLTIVYNRASPCAPLDPSRVLGVAVQITSNQNDPRIGFQPGYKTDLGNGDPQPDKSSGELVRLLGVYDVRGSGATQPGQQQAFLATIPANTPFELHLLDREYGLKLTDVRSWHSLQVRERRNDCGGCHNHAPGGAIPYTSTSPPLDLVRSTPYLGYNASCQPVVSVDSSAGGGASRPMPEWRVDIWPKVQNYCAGCHNSAPASAVWSTAIEDEAYRQLMERNYAHAALGALGSPAYWAARGRRTDGRDNNNPYFNKTVNGSGTVTVFPYRYSAVHDTLQLCSGSDPVKAAWVYTFGQWIDNHLPRSIDLQSGAKNATYDFYHPAVDLAVVTDTCSADAFRVGWWDESGSVADVRVTRKSDGLVLFSQSNAANSLVSFVRGSVSLGVNEMLQVRATDATGNRQSYEKRVGELIEDCLRSLVAPVVDGEVADDGG